MSDFRSTVGRNVRVVRPLGAEYVWMQSYSAFHVMSCATGGLLCRRKMSVTPGCPRTLRSVCASCWREYNAAEMRRAAPVRRPSADHRMAAIRRIDEVVAKAKAAGDLDTAEGQRTTITKLARLARAEWGQSKHDAAIERAAELMGVGVEVFLAEEEGIRRGEREIEMRAFAQLWEKAGRTHKQPRGDKVANIVEIYRTEGGMAIRSIAKDEREFVDSISGALADGGFDGDDMRAVLPYVIDIACKMRGYKAPTVIEERVLIAGPGVLPADALVVQANFRGATSPIGARQAEVSAD